MIYFVQARMPDRAGPIKIGYTSADGVWQRIEQLQTGCPWDLVVLRTTPGGMREETTLHRRFKHLSMGREWFEFSPELLAFAMAQPSMEGTQFAPRTHPGRAQPTPGSVVHLWPERRVAADA